MAVVVIVAVVLAAARAGAFAFVVVAMSAATLGVLMSRGAARAFLLGCSVFGWASLLAAFGPAPATRFELPTTRLIIGIYEMFGDPAPAFFRTPEEANLWVVRTLNDATRALTTGYSLIALVAALAGGVVAWLIAGLLARRAART